MALQRPAGKPYEKTRSVRFPYKTHDEAAERKKNGFGELERRRTAKAQLDTLRARLEEPFHMPDHEAALRSQTDQSR